MEELIEQLEALCLDKVQQFSFVDQNFILEALSGKLQVHANNALMAEYGIMRPEDEE